MPSRDSFVLAGRRGIERQLLAMVKVELLDVFN